VQCRHHFINTLGKNEQPETVPPFWYLLILMLATAAVQCPRQLAAEAVQGRVEQRGEAVDPGCAMCRSFRAPCCHKALGKEAMVASLPATCLLPAWMMVQFGPRKVT